MQRVHIPASPLRFLEMVRVYAPLGASSHISAIRLTLPPHDSSFADKESSIDSAIAGNASERANHSCQTATLSRISKYQGVSLTWSKQQTLAPHLLILVMAI